MKNTANIFITDLYYSCDDKSFAYILGFQPTKWSMVLFQDELYIILDSRYFAKTKNIDEKNIKEIIWNEKLKIHYIEVNEHMEEISRIILEKNNLWKVFIEWKVASEYTEELIKKTNKKIEILKWWFFTKKRIKKNNLEKQSLKKAIEIIDKVFLHIEKLNKEWELIWKTELQVRSTIISKIMDFGWTWESFDSIVAFGENSAIPHYRAWNTIIWNWVLLIDMWALYNWYCSDFTRTIWVWKKNGQYKKFQEIYDIVKNAHLNAFKNSNSWFTWKEIDALTRDYIIEKWYWDKYIHNTGHWVGLDIHEEPRITKKSETIIEDGMFFTIEPWIYLEWEFWIRLEDIVFMEKGKLKKYSKIDI